MQQRAQQRTATPVTQEARVAMASEALFHYSPPDHPTTQLMAVMQSAPLLLAGAQMASQIGESEYVRQQGEASAQRIGTGRPVAQLKRAPAEVEGITHLVKKKGNSIQAGAEEHEVEGPAVVEVETNDRIRSRRGPNQEEFNEYDSVSPHMYRWYGVRQAPELGETVKEWYIREDAFKWADERADRPKVSTNLEGRHGGERRTRGSHHRLRFEAWFNTSRESDQSGHMMMYDAFGERYLEYAQKRIEFHNVNSTLLKLDKLEGIGTKPAEILKAYASLRPRFESILKESESIGESGIININGHAMTKKELAELIQSLAMFAKTEPWQLGVYQESRENAYNRRKNEKKRPITELSAPRFNKLHWAAVMLPNDLYITLRRRFDFRTEHGFYFLLKELQEKYFDDIQHYPEATRCLSVLEDTANLQRVVLVPGHAEDVLITYIRNANIQEQHHGNVEGRENLFE
jgi:hypothetical protein